MPTVLNDKDYKMLAAAYAQYALEAYRRSNPAKTFDDVTRFEDLNMLEGFYINALQYYAEKVKLSDG